MTSPADVTEYVAVSRQVFPDLQYTVDDVVGVRWTATETHQSDPFGIEPQGRCSSSKEPTSSRSQTVEWSVWETLRMAQELPFLPSPGLDGE